MRHLRLFAPRWLVSVSLVTLGAAAQAPSTRPPVFSTLQTIAVDRDGRSPVTVHTKAGYFEAPNWTKDGKSLLFDEGGRIMRVPLGGGEPVAINTGTATRCNGSHGLSPDGRSLAITCSFAPVTAARVAIVPLGGGTPRIVTQNANSYFHSWSPDGSTLLFSRPDAGSLNIYAIPAAGGEERPLTTGTGVSDDPDFSPDGKYIYFNSDRGGTMQIWRMGADGSAPEQMTAEERVNWTPHVSPDGKLVVYLSYRKDVTGHPANQPVSLRLLSLADRQVRTLVEFFGGAGSINVPSWAPDSRSLAFVSYKLMAAADPAASPH